MNKMTAPLGPDSDDQLNDALADLRAELSIEPSPEFAAKVRQQIDAEPARRGWNMWAWTSVVATCGIAIVAGALWMRSGGEVLSPGVVTTEPSPVPSIAQHMTTTPTPTGPTTTTTASNANATNHSGVAARATTRPAAVVAAVTKPELEVLVPMDQMDAIRRLMASVRTGAVKDMPASSSAVDPDTGELIKPKPIEIPLITIEPLPGTVEGRSGGSERK